MLEIDIESSFLEMKDYSKEDYAILFERNCYLKTPCRECKYLEGLFSIYLKVDTGGRAQVADLITGQFTQIDLENKNSRNPIIICNRPSQSIQFIKELVC